MKFIMILLLGLGEISRNAVQADIVFFMRVKNSLAHLSGGRYVFEKLQLLEK